MNNLLDAFLDTLQIVLKYYFSLCVPSDCYKIEIALVTADFCSFFLLCFNNSMNVMDNQYMPWVHTCMCSESFYSSSLLFFSL